MIKIDIKGPIVSDGDRWFYDWLDMPATAPKDIVLPADNSAIEVYINSGGGDVYAGSEIYTMLREYAGDVTVKVVGVAASAASVIAMAGDKVLVSPTDQLMIHNVSTQVSGDHKTMMKQSGVLEGFNESIANSYIAKTGLELSSLLEMMNEETWLTADKAVELGFADEVLFAENQQMAPALVAGIDKMIPSNFINQLAKVVNQKQEIDYEALADKVAQRMQASQSEPVSNTQTVPKRGFGAFFNS